MRHFFFKKNRIAEYIRPAAVLAAGLIFVLAFAACGTVEKEEEEEIQVYHETESTSYTMDVVRRGTVSSTESVSVTYTQILKKDVAFAMDGLYITNVYVENGDAVVKGQVLAECDLEDVRSEKESLEENVRYYEMKMRQVKETRDLELSIRRDELRMTAGNSDDIEKMNEDLDDITESYRTQIEDYEDKIYIANLKIQECEKKIEQGTLYAPITGNISFVKGDIIGTKTEDGVKIFTIVDNTVCAYVGAAGDSADLFRNEESVMLSVGYGSSKTSYTAYPAYLDDWGENMYFLPQDGFTPAVGSHGSVSVGLEEADDVLYIGNSYVHSAGDRYYVYVMDENGYRTVQYIEIGLIGANSTEIVSGLNEGDMVILK